MLEKSVLAAAAAAVGVDDDEEGGFTAEFGVPVVVSEDGQVFSWKVYGAFILLGFSSWCTLIAVWSELPHILTLLPEGANLSTWLVLIQQSSNIFPLALMLYGTLSHKALRQWILVDLSVGLVVCIGLMYAWNKTMDINGTPHSMGLYVLIFLSGAYASSTNVLYYPFVARFPRVYTSALVLGFGLCGTLLGFLSIVQEIGDKNPRFSVEVYFFMVTIMMLSSIAAFLWLSTHPWGLGRFDGVVDGPILDDGGNDAADEGDGFEGTEITTQIERNYYFALVKQSSCALAGSCLSVPPLLVMLPMCLQGYMAGINYGVLTSLLPVSCLSYSQGTNVYMWANVVTYVVAPLVNVVTSFDHLVTKDMRTITGLSVLATAAWAVLVKLAAMSPQPYFVEQPLGGLLPVLLCTAFAILNTYVCTCLFLYLRLLPAKLDDDKLRTHMYINADRLSKMDALPAADGRVEDSVATAEEKEAYIAYLYRWSGFVVQIGGSIGAILTFVVVVVIQKQ